MTELILVRHGLTDSNRARRYQGHLDIPLNDEGRAQSARLAARLRGVSVDALYSSDLTRAMETACLLGAALDLAPVARADLREIDVGDAVGKTREDMRASYPELFGAEWVRTPFPNGESYEQLAMRLGRALRSIAVAHPGQTVVVVTHGGAIRASIAALTDSRLEDLGGIAIANTSLTRLAIDAGASVRVLAINDVVHLDSLVGAGARDPG